MSNGISYSRELVEAAKQHVRSPSRVTVEQFKVLRKFHPKGSIIEASAEILLNLLEGADVHDSQPAKPQTCGKCASFRPNGKCFDFRPGHSIIANPNANAPKCFQPRKESV